MRLCLALLLFACGASPARIEPPPASDPETDAKQDQEGIDRMAVKPPAAPGKRGPMVGSQAPGGAFKTTDGRTLELPDALATRGAIIVFYRGHWCRQCRKQLEELEAARKQFEGRGFQIFAVSTDEPQQSAELKTKLNLGFELLTDKGGIAIANWGVYTTVHELARPSVFVVAPGGRIAYRYVSDSPADRPAVETLLKEAEQASPGEQDKP